MATYRIKINQNSIKKKVLAAAHEKGARVAQVKINILFKRAYNTMLKRFDEHNVTQEILAGPFTSNISGTLEGYGNLFSFIGFKSGDNPIARLRDLLSQETFLKQAEVGRNLKGQFTNKGKFYFKVILPSSQRIASVTQMPWEQGSSWAEGIETEISGLSYFLQKRTRRSRSGGGIQIRDHEVNDDLSFQKTPYLSEIFKSFRESVNRGL